jgi:hypothetical protein
LASAATPSATAAATRPAAITIRSPYRSAIAPHAISVSTTPISGHVISTLAEPSDSPNARRSSGRRYGNP